MDLSEIPPELRAKVMAALFEPQDHSKDVRRLKSSSFPGGVIELDVVSEPAQQQGDITHNCDLLCPKCGAYQLKARVATLVELSNIEVHRSCHTVQRQRAHLRS
ncbi:hypothetical protein CONPUDRAFT_85231 [Coniophora puteana RWD-64-598 SS2]|uniref:Uncharacterized protein n=1 Tax=Coniophora puteana (strain RWD-64-598) TaxID=741705 RepID=A0A5M3MB88_CONPW|nr:uncharacterized protein CONPUDRAFT_85231 [Coniophora puteana RWD-64-598 SS2]EIW76070.1 hypothetical protein CONPUDRAFT_85231 [Coniophora puteana RWD-64-598 SS2]